jgi:2-methylcitrate dehydratase PrpD
VARALLRGEVSEAAFSQAALVDQDVTALARRVEVIDDAEFNAAFPRTRGAELRLDLESGETLVGRVDVPRGMPDNPAEPAEIEAKFEALVAPLYGASRAAAIAAAVGEVERRPLRVLLAELEPQAEATPSAVFGAGSRP